jgi:hypothetical protein
MLASIKSRWPPSHPIPSHPIASHHIAQPVSLHDLCAGGTVCAYCFTPFAPDMRLYSDAQIAGIAKVAPPFERPRASTSPP